jgi:hypothetical protein
VQCDYGATCKVIGGVAKCECNFTCTDSKSLVCGSDLQTYDNECKMRETGCKAKRNIIVLVNAKCGILLAVNSRSLPLFTQDTSICSDKQFLIDRVGP